LPPGNQSVYDNYSRKLVNIYPDQKKVLFFNEKTRKWSSEFVYPTTLTEFWHTNKFVSAVDSSIYVVGGYGQLTYKNKVQRYHKPSEKWEEISTNGDTLAPRYLAALGAGPRGTVYIIGGYGSLTGQQMLSPQNYYDLLTYDVKTRKFTRLYEFENIEQDFAFVNSLVIDKSSNTFYGLVFPNNKYNSQLQLLKGRLDKPEYEFAGDKIPYEFHDIESFADLFYSPSSKKLIAVTLFFRKNDVTDVKIYSLHFPPGKIENQAVSKKSMAYMFLIGIVIVVLCIPVVFLLKRKRGEKRKQEASMANDPQDDFPLPLGDNVLPVERSIAIAGRSSILLFGQLQVFDTEGNDITKLFTPLVKELLLVIIIYTIRRERGVSSEKLNELLWYDKSEKDARNNRSVNIAKLKSILEKVGCGHISKETGYWKLELSADGIFIDYQQYVNIIKRRANLDKSFIEELITIIQRGSLLENTDYEWLDDLKSEVSDEIINILLAYANETGIEKDPEFLIRLMNYVFYFDNVNEEAMLIKCKALVLLGKHTLAHHSFEKFKKDYHALYGEEYELSFPEIVDFKE
jgi:DNA-binding SARP family transcriptional activator